MNPSTPLRDLGTQWNSARQLYPIYFELAREFSIEVEAFADLETEAETPTEEIVAQANEWLDHMDGLVQVHQLRQFLQTSSLVNAEGLKALIAHFLAKPTKDAVIRDKVDFLLVQFFSQLAPSGVNDSEVNLAYVADALAPVLGEVELKPPVWLNALDRVLESSHRCRSLDELLHGGILDQGRKAKDLAGDLFYLPIALVAFTRFGYLMRRAFFRLMLGDLNAILEGLDELEEKGVATIDCRRAQFSAQEPIIRLRMICQSWKVMFQAEYSSGQPLRMLVDLRAAVDFALGRGKAPAPEAKAEKTPAAQASAGKAAAGKTATAKTAVKKTAEAKTSETKISETKTSETKGDDQSLSKAAGASTKAATKPAADQPPSAPARAAAAAASAGFKSVVKPGAKPPAAAKPAASSPEAPGAAPEFEVHDAFEWNPEDSTPTGNEK